MDIIIFIIPTIGRDSLSKSIDSLINLECNNTWKALIIFDGVKNNIPNFTHKNIIFIEIEKCGNIDLKNNAGLVRNYGLNYIINNNIKSKYIGFLDDDDTLHPNYINNLCNEEKNFEFDCIIFRMMFPNYKIVPHQLTNKIQRCNVGISFALKYDIIYNNKYRFINNAFEDYIFLIILKKDKKKILLSKYINYFVKTDYNKCKSYIRNYPNILFN